MTTNRLKEQTSPYLLLHAENPVHWQPWDEQALQLAQHENKPILLSIGYSACHWCHVMAQESFENSKTAAVMNELFVNIKVDREERPDLDTIYQTALSNMGQQKGWPLTMFLNPKGEPFGGGTYFPPVARQGMPSFIEALHAAVQTYRSNPEKAMENTSKLTKELGNRPSGKGEISYDLLNHAANQLLDSVDTIYGGLGMEAKFPQPMFQELMWRAYCRTRHSSYKNAVENTLDHMCLGGIYDHIGGGFARYTIDDKWQIPHFEKMLYDNALIISLLNQVWLETKSPLYANCIKETADWIINEMQLPEGGFASALSANSDGYKNKDAGEGAYYIWDEAEIDNVLNEDSELFKEFFDVSTQGNWQGTNILNRIDKPLSKNTEVEKQLTKLKEKLRVARNSRPRPIQDDKVLVDWNGLVIAALVEASVTFNCPHWLEAACQAFTCVTTYISEGESLFHSYRVGRHTAVAILDDYANMAHAALWLFGITSNIVYLEHAQAWVEVLDSHYWDEKEGGYFYTADNADSIIVRVKTARETSTPSGNGMMVSVLARLYALTSLDKYRDHAEKIISLFSLEVSSNYLAMATLMNSSELLQDLMQVVVLGNQYEKQTQQLLESIFSFSIPNRYLQIVASNTTLPASHPVAGKTQIDGKPTVYICQGTSCELPITEVDEVKNIIKNKLHAN